MPTFRQVWICGFNLMVSTIKYKKNTGLPRFGGFKCKEGKDWEKNMYKEKKIH